MTSEQLNDKIREIVDDESIDFEAFGGKKIPYIGWFWREVNFDRFLDYGYSFGVIPPEEDSDTFETFKGFMENNKWGYSTVRATSAQCKTIHAALIKAVTTKSNEDLQAVNDLIQAI